MDKPLISEENILLANAFILDISKLIHAKETSYWANNLPINFKLDELKDKIRYHEETRLNTPRVSQSKIDSIVDIALKSLDLSNQLDSPSTDLQNAKQISLSLKSTAQNILLLVSPDKLSEYQNNNPVLPNELHIEQIRKSQELLDSIEARIKLLSNQSASLENTFIKTNDKINRLETKSQEQIEAANDAFTEFAAESNSSLNKKAKELSDSYEKTIESLKKSEEEVSKLIGIVTSRSLAGDYEKSSVKEGILADRFRWATMIAMSLVVCLLGWTVFDMKDGSILSANIAGRIVISLLLSVPITYLARESSKHRMMQNKHFQTALDLAALSPFLSTLTPENSEKIRTDVASKLFFAEHTANSIDSLPINAQDLLNKLIDKLNIDPKK